MSECRLYKLPIVVLVAIAHLFGGSLASVRAASVNLDAPQLQSECPKSLRKSSSDGAKLLPEKDSDLANLSNNLGQKDSNSAIAQLPDTNTARPIDSGCEVSGEGACEVGGDSGCEVGGPLPAQGGGILPALAAAGGFNPLFLAPLALLPLIPGGGDNDDPPAQIPEPSTVFGSAVALGVVAAIAKKRKSQRVTRGKKR